MTTMDLQKRARAYMTVGQRATLQHHMRCKLYDRNGTGDPKRIIKRVFVPSDRFGHPLLILVCQYGGKDKKGRFDFCVFTDVLAGKKHVPSDSFGFGTEKDALDSLKEHVFGALTGVWPWVINQNWTITHQLLQQGK